jgi:hypothetical protein
MAAFAAGAYFVNRVRVIAEQQGRPVTDVVADLPGILVNDLSSLGEDLREAVEEGRAAARRQMDDLDEQLAHAGGAEPDPI